MQVAFDQVAVGQVQGWRLDDAMHHFCGMVKKPLIVRAEGRAVSNNQGLLARPPRTTTALGVIGGGRWHIAQVNSVQGGNIHAQFHGGRTKHDGQTLQRCFVRGVGQPVLAVFFGVAKALFQQLAATSINLGSVLLRFKIE